MKFDLAKRTVLSALCAALWLPAASALAETALNLPSPVSSAPSTALHSAPLEPLDVHARTSLTIVEQLRHTHYVRKSIDDKLSSEIFEKYLSMLDNQRMYCLWCGPHLT